MNRHTLAIIAFLYGIDYVGTSVAGQENQNPSVQYIEDMIENHAEAQGMNEDIAETLEENLTCPDIPLNINSASEEQFCSLNILSGYQIAAIIDYRNRKGPFLSLYELLYIPGFRQVDLDRIQQCVVCLPPEPRNLPLRKIVRSPAHKIAIRYQRLFELQEGYRRLADTVMASDKNQVQYMGSPDKIMLKYNLTFNRIFNTAIIMEKDAGEDFFHGSNKQGFDYTTAYGSFKNNSSFIRNVILGDYQVRQGQGVLMWNGYSSGKTACTERIFKNAELFQSNNSVDENRFLRGIAFTIGNDKISFSSFGSIHRIDANLADSSYGENFFSGLTESGNHTTSSELEKENSLQQTVAGSSLKLTAKSLKLGLNAIYMKYDKTCIPEDDLYQAYSFSGNKLLGVSLDYKVLYGRAQFFGESAYANNHFAMLNGMLIYLKPEITLGIIHRQYSYGYYSYFANAFGENTSVGNENGCYIGSEFNNSTTWCRMFVDLFRFPWLKYRVNAPSEGYEVFFECGRRLNSSEFSFRYNYKEKPENSIEVNHCKAIQPITREKYRIQSKYTLNSCLKIEQRVELVRAGIKGETKTYGYYLAQDFVVNIRKFPAEFALRAAYFHAVDFEARLYAFEREVYSAGISQMLYGEGWRFMVFAKWNLGDKISCRLKIGQLLYPKQNTIGSGGNKIDKNHRTELKLQLSVKI